MAKLDKEKTNRDLTYCKAITDLVRRYSRRLLAAPPAATQRPAIGRP
jgi:hypothetical protein